MKYIKRVLFYFSFFFFGGIVTILLLKYDNPLMNFYKDIKYKPYKYKLLSSLFTVKAQPNVNKKYISNDFEINLIPGLDNKIYNKTAGIIVKDNEVTIFEQYDIFAIWEKYKLADILINTEPALDVNNGYNGGLKKIFIYENNLFAFISLKEKNTHCFFASLINLTKRKEIFRSPCLPDFNPPDIDFNGIGGGFVGYKEGILFAVSAPTSYRNKTESLTQNMNSPYGKILYFRKEQLLNGTDNKFHFEIYSSGHRNIQGMVNYNEKIFAVEHGPRGGDELNLIIKNKNYGWPVISLGTEYNFKNSYKPYENDEKYKGPLYSFVPSVATSDIIECPKIIKERYYPLTCFLISSLKAKSLFIILIDEKDNDRVISVETIDVGMRLRHFFKYNDKLFVTTDINCVYEIVLKSLLH